MAEGDVLVVEDDRAVREILNQTFLNAGYKCLLAYDGREGFEMFRKSRPPLVITEINMPMMSGAEMVDGAGIELLKLVRREDPDAAVIVLGVTDLKTHIASLKLGADAHFWKPFSNDELLIAAERAIERRQLLIERRRRGDAQP